MVDAEVAIVGGGVNGLAAAWRLALTGRAVVLLEQFSLGHDRGSSHGATRIFRFAYDDVRWVSMAQRALVLWRELDATLISMTGGLDLGDERFLTECAGALSACGARAERLDEGALRERFDWLEVSGAPALYSPDTGVIAAARTLRTLSERATEHGADLRTETVVRSIDEDEDGVTLRTDAGPVRAHVAVLAAGAWLGGFVAGLPLRVTREQVFFFEAPHDTVPVIDRTRTPPMYVVPGLHGAPGIKVAEHHAGAATTAEEPHRELDPHGEHRVRAFVRERLPAVAGEPTASETCLYTTTPDEAFVLERRGRVVVASACSGHAFKFAPLVGDAIACLATGREPPFPLDGFSSARFHAGGVAPA